MRSLADVRENSDPKKFEGFGAEQFEYTIEFLEPHLLLATLKGKALPGDLDDVFKIFEDYVPGGTNAWMIVDLIKFERFPLKERKAALDKFLEFIKEERIAFTFLIQPNTFIKMVAQLVGMFYHDIGFSVENDIETAKQKFRANKELSISKAVLVQQAIESAESNSFIKVAWLKEFRSSSNPENRARLIALEPNIVLAQYFGKVVGDVEKNAIEVMQKHYQDLGNAYYMIADVSKTTGIDKEARQIANSKETRQLMSEKAKHIYYKGNAIQAIMFKAFSLINKEFARNTTVINSIENTIVDLLQEHEVTTESINNILLREDIQADELETFDKETLINYVQVVQSEMNQIRIQNEQHIEAMISGLSNITWNSDYSGQNLPVLPENDRYHLLFKMINFIQEDIGELIAELKDSNIHLEQIVESRTRKISQTESNLRSIIENFSTPIWLIDNNYSLLEFNSVFERNMKEDFGIVLTRGQNILEIFPAEIADFWKSRYDLCLSGKKQSYFEDYQIAHLGHLHFEVKTFPIYANKKIIGVGVVAVDITELQKSKVELEAKNKSLRKVNSELDSFIYRSSHDLRAPISSVKGLIQIAKMEGDPKIKDQYLDKMVKTMDKLDGFIHEIMDITKNEKLDIQSEEIHVGNLVDQVLDELAHSEEVSKIKIQKDIGRSPKLISDTNRLKTLLKNVIANSIKYRDEEKNSRIEIRTYRNKGNMMIEIEDNGEGIPKDSLSQITTMFYRAHPSKSGSGLGLYIVREILNKLQGDMKIDSVYKEFTKVTITIPLILKK